MNDFLYRVNYSKIHQLPFNNDPHKLSVQTKIDKKIQRLTGIGLMKRNVSSEARRLRLHNQRLINLATNRIWRLKYTGSQRRRFIN